jgi:hypothetical protein
VERVVRVLDHHRHGRRRDQERGIDVGVQIGDGAGGGLISVDADHRLGRVEEVVDGRALAKELRVDGESEVPPPLLAAGALERGKEELFCHPRQRRASEDDNMPLALVAQRGADLLADVDDAGNVRRAVRIARRAHTNERKIGRRDGFGGIGGGGEPAVTDMLCEQFFETLFKNWAPPGGKRRDLLLRDVDPDNAMPALRKAAGGDRADVAEAEDADAGFAQACRVGTAHHEW